MQWVFQSTGLHDAFTRDLLAEVQRQGLPYRDIGMINFSHEFIGLEDLDPTIATFFFGSVQMVAKLQDDPTWKRGIFHNEDFNVSNAPQRDDMLNPAPMVWHWNQFNISLRRHPPSFFGKFIRPVSSFKYFPGFVLTEKNFKEKMEIIEAVNASFDYGSKKPRVAVSEYHDIWAEWRFFVIDGEVVTGSMYRDNGGLRTKIASDDLLLVAQAYTRKWLPSPNCVMDLALTTDGLKVVEFNSINSSGTYDCDLEKLVKAITMYMENL